MIISKTVHNLPPVISAPTIGVVAAREHLARHRHLFNDFVSSLRAAEVRSFGQDPSPGVTPFPPHRATCGQIIVHDGASRLSSDDGYSFAADLAAHLTCVDLLAGVEQGALLHIASIHSRVISMNYIRDSELDRWIGVNILIEAIEQDAEAVFLIVANAAIKARVTC